jgi:hypothetical protein
MPFKVPRLPYGERTNDPHRDEQTLRFRFNIAVRRANPLLIGFTTALIVCMIPLTLILVQQNELRRQALAARHQRFEATALICDLKTVVTDTLAQNPGARISPPTKVRLTSVDCPRFLDEILHDLGENATRREKARAAQD